MWLAIISLLIVGILLILTELIFIPGTTIFGIAGLILTAAGVILSFVSFSTGTGFLVLGVTFLCLVAMLVVSFRSNTWDKVSLKGTNTSKVNDQVKNTLWKGDKGVALSALRPSGKAEFNNTTVEVSTLGQYVEANSQIRIIAVKDKKILVEAVEN